MTQQHVMPRWFRWAGVVAFVLIVLALVVVPSGGRLYAEPAGAVTMSIEPATRAVLVGDTFTVQVVADVGTEMDANGLGAYEFDWLYDSNYLDFVSFTDAGDLTGPNSRTVAELGPVDVTGGKAVGAYSYKDGAPTAKGPTGNGITLANVTLKAKRAGAITLALQSGLLVDTQATEWPNAGAGRLLNLSSGNLTLFLTSDFDKDATADPATYQPSTGRFTISRSSSGYAWLTRYGQPNVQPYVGDLDGDAASDPVSFNTTSGAYVYFPSATGFTWTRLWGVSNGQAIVADADGDGKMDLVSYQPSSGKIVMRRSSSPGGFASDWFQRWGESNTTAFAADFDGDGSQEPATFNETSGQFIYFPSTTGFTWTRLWGVSNGQAIVADVDGDGAKDFVSYQSSSGKIVMRRSSIGFASDWYERWGLPNAQPLVADVDGDLKDDVATFNPSTGKFAVLRSASGFSRLDVFGQGNSEAILADMDGDDVADLVTYRQSDGRFVIQHGPAFSDWALVATGEANKEPVVTDFNGDGIPDLGTFDATTGRFHAQLSPAPFTTGFNRWSVGTSIVPAGY